MFNYDELKQLTQEEDFELIETSFSDLHDCDLSMPTEGIALTIFSPIFPKL